ncbi:uncharacterized protein At5g41620-like [Olea europaea var. sylvestris]|uniref:uncharacterized protein At5g41620-like n=1 Tax=Olea europaea var. sylvestris TaxID=158386 RepID=UPI000C1D64B0|nr:uncharacterized protein At5g41620-like [Olea europaea var. sylvestris]
MPREKLKFDGKIGQSKVRKRGCSSSSSSSLVRSYRLKRAILLGKRSGGSSIPVRIWKRMSSRSPSLKNGKYLVANVRDKAKDLSITARKLATMLREINGFSSSRVKRENSEEKISELGIIRKRGVLKRMDPSKVGSHLRRASAGSQKLLQSDCNLGGFNSPHNFLLEVDRAQSHGRTPCRHAVGGKNRLKDVHNGLMTSKELLKVLSRVWCLEEQRSTSLSLVSSLKFELERVCVQVNKLIQEQRTNGSEIDILLRQFEEEKTVRKIKERDRIRSAITTISGELEIERKLRRQTERLNKKLGRELAETKTYLSSAIEELETEKRAREILEQACDELARGIGEDRAKVEEIKIQSAKVREEVEKEREMLQLADVLREERVQMKLSEAKYEFEEKNAIVDELRSELESYLKSKAGREGDESPPSCEKIKQLKKYLRETLPGSRPYQDKENENIESVNKENPGEEDDLADSDLHSIELNVNDISKSYEWSIGIKNEPRNSVDKIKGRKSISEKIKKPNISETRFADGKEWEFTSIQEKSDVFDKRGLFEFSSQPWKKNTEDEIERYNMIKDLRDHIVSGSRIASSQNMAGGTKNCIQHSVPVEDHNGGGI